MPAADVNIIQNSVRLDALQQTDLLDTPDEEAFDRLTKLASRIVKAPVALVSLIGVNRQFFKSIVGLPDPWLSQRQTPLSHSFCQHVVATGESLIISDSRQHPLVYDNLAITDLNVISYLGMPLTDTAGNGLGSFCVIDSEPRQWTPDEIEILRDLSRFVMTEIELRAELKKRQQAEAELNKVNRSLDNNVRHLQRVTEFASTTIEYTIEAVQRGAVGSEILAYLSSAKQSLMLRKHKLE